VVRNRGADRLPRQQRRAIDRRLREPLRSDARSACGNPLAHNSWAASGLDTGGDVVLAGECCIARVGETFRFGPSWSDEAAVAPTSALTGAQLAEGIGAYLTLIARPDKRLAT
jgi:hypothetical protein